VRARGFERLVRTIDRQATVAAEGVNEVSEPNLSVVDLAREGDDALLVLRIGSEADRFFSPMLAARILLDVRGLVHQSCFSRPEPRSGSGAKEGIARSTRRWAFAQEIYSNEGRGTESGHFLEHLVLEMALGLTHGRRSRRFAAETSWNWRKEPDVYRVRFDHASERVVAPAVVLAASVLAEHDYRLELGPLANMVVPPLSASARVQRPAPRVVSDR
jgi:hypothetical protein